MENPTSLKRWMAEKGYSNSELAQQLGFSYEYIYKLAIGRDKPLTDGFKWRFIQRFGWEEANKVFDAIPQSPVQEVTA